MPATLAKFVHRSWILAAAVIALQCTVMADTPPELGHQVTVTLSPGPLDQFDVVFVGGHEVDQNALIDYVKRGGKVYVSGGGDANGGIWNDFLTRFGLYSQADSMAEPAPGSGYDYPPLFAGVSSLNLNKLFHIVRKSADVVDAQTICSQSETNAWGIYRAGEKLGPTPAQIAAKAAKIAAAADKVREHNGAVAGRIVDEVIVGNEASERDHKLQGENMRTAAYLGRQWRSAFDGGWFSYTMAVDPAAPVVLNIMYFGGDGAGRDFDIEVDGKKLVSVSLRARGNSFYGCMYPIPPSWTIGKSHIVVRFGDHPNNIAGGIYGCRVMAR